MRQGQRERLDRQATTATTDCLEQLERQDCQDFLVFQVNENDKLQNFCFLYTTTALGIPGSGGEGGDDDIINIITDNENENENENGGGDGAGGGDVINDISVTQSTDINLTFDVL